MREGLMDDTGYQFPDEDFICETCKYSYVEEENGKFYGQCKLDGFCEYQEGGNDESGRIQD